jgi:hypothetical protein
MQRRRRQRIVRRLSARGRSNSLTDLSPLQELVAPDDLSVRMVYSVPDAGRIGSALRRAGLFRIA